MPVSSLGASHRKMAAMTTRISKNFMTSACIQRTRTMPSRCVRWGRRIGQVNLMVTAGQSEADTRRLEEENRLGYQQADHL